MEPQKVFGYCSKSAWVSELTAPGVELVLKYPDDDGDDVTGHVT